MTNNTGGGVQMDIRETHENFGPEQEVVVDKLYGLGGEPMMPLPLPPNHYYGGRYHRGECGCGSASNSA